MFWSSYFTRSYHRHLLEAQIREHAHLVRGEVLEVGSGRRRYDHLFQANITAVDIRPDPENRVIQGDMHNLFFGNDSFDVVLSFEVLCYATDHKLALSEMIRVTKPGGTLLLSVPFMLRDSKDNIRFTRAYAESLMGDYDLQEVQVQTIGNSFTIVWDVLRSKLAPLAGTMRGRICKILSLPILAAIQFFHLSRLKDDINYSGIFLRLKRR